MTGQFVTTALTGVLVSAGITGNAFYPRYGNPAGYLTSATQSSQSPWTGNIAASAHNLSGVNTGLFNKVGILNNNPAFPLDVIGNINLNGDLYVNANRTLIASGNSIVLGQNSPTAGVGLGTYSVNIGYAANCAGTDSISIGCTNVTNGSRAVGITRDGGAWNDGSIAIGYQANAGATDAIAIGRNSTCDGVDSIVMGIGVITDITSVFILGNGQKVGINHYEPTYQLDVSGNGRFSDGLSANGYAVVTSNQTGQFLVHQDTGVLIAAGITGNAFYPRYGNPSNFMTAAGTGEFVDSSKTGNFITNGMTGHIHSQYALIVGTGQFISTAQTGNFISNGMTGHIHSQYALIVGTGQFISTAQTGNFISNGMTGVLVPAGVTGNAFYPRYGNPSAFITAQQDLLYISGIQTVTGQKVFASGLRIPFDISPTWVSGNGGIGFDCHGSGQFIVSSGLNQMVVATPLKSFTFVLESPKAETFPMYQTPYAITLQRYTTTITGVSGALNVNLGYGSDLCSALTNVSGGWLSVGNGSSNCTQRTYAGLSSKAVAANNYLVFLSTQQGAYSYPEKVIVKVEYTIDRS
jgi:hypothetical protein